MDWTINNSCCWRREIRVVISGKLYTMNDILSFIESFPDSSDLSYSPRLDITIPLPANAEDEIPRAAEIEVQERFVSGEYASRWTNSNTYYISRRRNVRNRLTLECFSWWSSSLMGLEKVETNEKEQ